jgi:tRNA A-37 threonylcarbamoyl transferase component Bud32
LLELSRKIGASDASALCLYADHRESVAVAAVFDRAEHSNPSPVSSRRGSTSTLFDDTSDSQGPPSPCDLRLLNNTDLISSVMLSWGPFVTDNRLWVAHSQPVATTFWQDAENFFSFALSETTRAADVIQFVADRDRVEPDALELVLERVSNSGSSQRKPKVDRVQLRPGDFLVSSARAVEREQNARARFVVERRQLATISTSPTKSRTLTDLLRFRSNRGVDNITRATSLTSVTATAAAAPAAASFPIAPAAASPDSLNSSKLIRAASANAVTHLDADGGDTAPVVIKKRRRRRRRSSRGDTSRSSVGSASGSSPQSAPVIELAQAGRRPSVVFALDDERSSERRASVDEWAPPFSQRSFAVPRGSISEAPSDLGSNATTTVPPANPSEKAASTSSSDLAAALELARIKSERVAKLRNMRGPMRTIQARLRPHAKMLTAFVYVVGVRGDDLDRDEAAMIDSAPRALAPEPPAISSSGQLDSVRRLAMVTSGRLASRLRGAAGAAVLADGYESASDNGTSTTGTVGEDGVLDGAADSSDGSREGSPQLAPRGADRNNNDNHEDDDDDDLDRSPAVAPQQARTYSLARFSSLASLTSERRASYDTSLLSGSLTSDSYSRSRFVRASVDLPSDSGLPSSTFHPIGLTIEVTMNETALSVVWSICSALCLPRWSEWGLFDSTKRIPDFEPVRSSDHGGDERRPWLAMRRLNNSAFTDRATGEMMLRDSTGLSSVNSSRRSSSVSVATTATLTSTMLATASTDWRPNMSDRRPSSDRRSSSTTSGDRRTSAVVTDEDGLQVMELASEVAQLRLKVSELDAKLAGERQSRVRAEAALARDSILNDKLAFDRTRFFNATVALRSLALRSGAATSAVNEALGSSNVAITELDASGAHRVSVSSTKSSSPSSSSTSSSSSSQLRTQFRIDWADLKVLEQIGEGAQSTVYYGHYRGQEVAIKVLRSLNDDKELERDFWNECDIMRTLRTTDTVYFFGATAAPNVAIVLEYCARGSLFDAMRRPAVQWPWLFVLRLMGQVATGLCALHGWKPAIVHRDLKSSNLMLDIHWKVKIGDFGVARFGGDERENDVQGTYAYIAPELYHGNECTAAVDIYSFAIIMWEVVNRAVTGAYAVPYTNERTLAQNFQILLIAALHNVRPTLPRGVPAEVSGLIEACWHPSPTSRPSAQRLVAMFEDAIQREAHHRRKWARQLFSRGKGKPINSDL